MEHVEHELPDLLMGSMSPDQRALVESHVAACPRCREIWEELRVLAPTRGLKRPDVPRGYFATLPARILERRTGSADRRRWFPALTAAGRVLGPVAAGILVIAALSWFSGGMNDPEIRSFSLPASDAVEYVSQDDTWNASDLSADAEELFSDKHMVLSGSLSEGVAGLEDLESAVTPDLVADLDDDQIDQIISRLSERSIL